LIVLRMAARRGMLIEIQTRHQFTPAEIQSAQRKKEMMDVKKEKSKAMVIAVVAAWDFLDECNISVVSLPYCLLANYSRYTSQSGLFGSYTVPKI
jgi:hypothetical protein